MVVSPWLSDAAILWSLNILLQVTVVTAFALSVVAFMKKSPALRYGLLLAGLVLLCLAPITASIQQWSGAGFLSVASFENDSAPRTSLVQVRENTDSSDLMSVPLKSVGILRTVEATDDSGSNRFRELGVEVVETRFVELARTSPRVSSEPLSVSTKIASSAGSSLGLIQFWVAILAMVWAGGSAVLLLRFCVASRRLAKMLESAIEVDNTDLLQLSSEVAKSMQLNRSPRLLVSSEVSSPIATGWMQPSIVLPAVAVLGPSSEQLLRAVLMHEMAHVARRDPAIACLQSVLDAVFWFHPLVKVLNQQLARAREEVCDNYVLNSVDSVVYCRTLLSFAQQLANTCSVPASVGLFTSSWTLESRVSGLLDEARSRRIKLSPRERLFVSIQFTLMFVLGTLVTFRSSVAQQAPLDTRKSGQQINAQLPVPDNLQQPIQRFGNANPMDNLGLVRSFSADGKQLIFSSDYAVTVWNLELNLVDWSLPLESPDGYLAISPDKRYLAVRSGSFHSEFLLQVYDLGLMQEVWRKSYNEIRFVTFSPMDNSVFVQSEQKDPLQILDIENGTQIGSLHPDGRFDIFNGFQISLDGRYIAITEHLKRGSKTKLWDLSKGECSWLPSNQGRQFKIQFAARNQIVSQHSTNPAISLSKVIRITNVETKEDVIEIPIDDPREPAAANSAVLSGDGTRLISIHKNKLVIWNTEEWNRVAEWTIPEVLSGEHPRESLAISADSRFLAFNFSNACLLFELETGKSIVQPTEKHQLEVTDIALSPNEKYLASSGLDGVVYLWNMQTGNPAKKVVQKKGRVKQIVFADDRRIVVSGGGEEGFLELIEIDTGKCLRKFNLGGTIAGMRMSADGSRIAVAIGSSNSSSGMGGYDGGMGGLGGGMGGYGGEGGIGDGNPKESPKVVVFGLEDGEVQWKAGVVALDGRSKLFFDDIQSRMAHVDCQSLSSWMERGGPGGKKVPVLRSVFARVLQRETSQVYLDCPPELSISQGLAWVSVHADTRMDENPFFAICYDFQNDLVKWKKDLGKRVVRHLLLSLDESLLAMGIDEAGTRSSIVLIVDPESGEELQRIESATLGRVTALRFAKDGTRLFTGMASGDVLAWDISKAYETKVNQK